MLQGLVHLHNVLRWVVLILLVIAVLRHLSGMTGNKPLTKGDQKTGILLMVFAHVQLLIGLIQWFFGPWGFKLVQSSGMAVVMKDPVFRFWTVEHNIGMLIAIILITIGRGVYRKNLPDVTRHKRSFWLFFIALILVVASIPWPGRIMGRPLFPGMG